MADFSYLQSFRLKDETDHSGDNLTHTFYPVKMSEVIEAEQRLNIIFPDDLDDFYKQVGYGFFYQKADIKKDINRFLDPSSIADVYLREGMYEYDADLEIYSDPDKLIFFEINEGIYLTVSLVKVNAQQAIYYLETKIADSLSEFVYKFFHDSDYIHQFDID